MAKTRTLEPTPFAAREAALLRKVKLPGAAGEQARKALLQMHYAWIQKRCAQVLRNEADAMDAAQEAALRIYDNLPRFEGRSSLRTWIGTIATRECFTILRRSDRHLISEHIAALIQLHEEVLRTPAAVADKLDADRVAFALDVLAPKYRELLNLRFYQDMSLDEISAALDISLSAAKMRLYRALDHFAVQYEAA